MSVVATHNGVVVMVMVMVMVVGGVRSSADKSDGSCATLTIRSRSAKSSQRKPDLAQNTKSIHSRRHAVHT
jgi:hypothetical protein